MKRTKEHWVIKGPWKPPSHYNAVRRWSENVYATVYTTLTRQDEQWKSKVRRLPEILHPEREVRLNWYFLAPRQLVSSRYTSRHSNNRHLVYRNSNWRIRSFYRRGIHGARFKNFVWNLFQACHNYRHKFKCHFLLSLSITVGKCKKCFISRK